MLKYVKNSCFNYIKFRNAKTAENQESRSDKTVSLSDILEHFILTIFSKAIIVILVTIILIICDAFCVTLPMK